MAKKKTITRSDLISMYMESLLEHNAPPKSIYSFAKSNNFDEALFYEHFGNFEALEQAIFIAFFDNTLIVLSKSADYESFDSRNKLISFYYTFFEILTANRSYVVYALQNEKNHLKKLRALFKLKQSFTQYIESLNIPLLDIKQEAIEKVQNKTLQESAWMQLLVTIKFWLEDTSSSFEKTDIFIEKSVNTSFEQ